MPQHPVRVQPVLRASIHLPPLHRLLLLLLPPPLLAARCSFPVFIALVWCRLSLRSFVRKSFAKRTSNGDTLRKQRRPRLVALLLSHPPRELLLRPPLLASLPLLISIPWLKRALKLHPGALLRNLPPQLSAHRMSRRSSQRPPRNATTQAAQR